MGLKNSTHKVHFEKNSFENGRLSDGDKKHEDHIYHCCLHREPNYGLNLGLKQRLFFLIFLKFGQSMIRLQFVLMVMKAQLVVFFSCKISHTYNKAYYYYYYYRLFKLNAFLKAQSVLQFTKITKFN